MTELPSRYDRHQDPLQVYAEADAETRAVIEKELDRIAAREVDPYSAANDLLRRAIGDR